MRNILRMTETALEQGKLIDLLKGKQPYHIAAWDFTPGYQPTDVGSVLGEGIYRLYPKRPEIKAEWENTLLQMARTDAFQFYVAVDYLRAQVFRESHRLSPFCMESRILREIGSCLELHREQLKEGITDANGTHYPEALRDILRWNQVTMENYGVQILPPESSEYAFGGD